MESKTVLITDHQIANAILKLVNQAKFELDLVTPFWDWKHLSNAVAEAIERNVKVRVLLKLDPQDSIYYWTLMDDLYRLGAKVFIIEGLHAKICRNEYGVVVGSMNFLASSAGKSREAAIYSNESSLISSTKIYIDKLASAKNEHKLSIKDKVLGTVASVIDSMRSSSYCIYCRKKISFDPSNPVCKDHNHINHSDTIGKYCHSCGNAASGTFTKPQCFKCWRDNNMKTGFEDRI